MADESQGHSWKNIHLKLNELNAYTFTNWLSSNCLNLLFLFGSIYLIENFNKENK